MTILSLESIIVKLLSCKCILTNNLYIKNVFYCRVTTSRQEGLYIQCFRTPLVLKLVPVSIHYRTVSCRVQKHSYVMFFFSTAINIQQFMPGQQPTTIASTLGTIPNCQRHKGGNHESRNIVVT